MSFFKSFLAALLAFIVGGVVFVMISVMFLAGIAAVFGTSSAPVVQSGSVLKIDLVDPISDAPKRSPLGSIDFNSMKLIKSNTTLSVLMALERAAIDDNIEGIYLNINGAANMTTIEEIRNAIIKFKESGKFVVSYCEFYSQSAYYLSSVADKIYLNPEGNLDWRGMAMNTMFYKGLLDKLGVKAEIIRHGTFKSAVEPFINKEMSPENRLQSQTLVDDLWSVVLGSVAQSRGLDSAELSRYASELTITTADHAKQYGLVDSLVYEDQVRSIINTMTSGKKTAKKKKGDAANSEDTDVDIKLVSLFDYINAPSAAVINTSDNKVAIIYVEGQIVDQASGEGMVTGGEIAAKLKKVRDDKNVKALVLRVNSPGGSALASEVMWREVELVRKHKPVVVSMGGVAASGGYYISCPADMIVADKFTITGSIGVFGMLFNAQEGLRDKLGVTVDVVKTNPSADMGYPFRGLSTQERDFLQKNVEKVYSTFVGHVANGRNLTVEAVDKIGQGRVWSGVRAAQIGLIDGFGGIKDAIALAADRAGVSDDFRIYQVVDAEDPISQILSSLSSVKTIMLKSELGDAFVHYNNVKHMVDQKGGIQAWMPYSFEID